MTGWCCGDLKLMDHTTIYHKPCRLTDATCVMQPIHWCFLIGLQWLSKGQPLQAHLDTSQNRRAWHRSWNCQVWECKIRPVDWVTLLAVEQALHCQSHPRWLDPLPVSITQPIHTTESQSYGDLSINSNIKWCNKHRREFPLLHFISLNCLGYEEYNPAFYEYRTIIRIPTNTEN